MLQKEKKDIIKQAFLHIFVFLIWLIISYVNCIEHLIHV